MGRQAHLTRLALGRSPYGEPLRDENGNFIIGPGAYANHDVGYRQEFDARGHPCNLASASASKSLLRAQNNVMAAVGVVTRRSDAQNPKWTRPRDKTTRIIQENEEGRELRTANRLFGVMFPWCLSSLRSRMMTFNPYYNVPVVTLSWLEWHLLGPWRFLRDGFPLFAISCVPQLFRQQVFRNPHVDSIVIYSESKTIHEEAPTTHLITNFMQAALFLVEIPLRVLSTLQILYLIEPNTLPSMSFFVPTAEMSPIYLPPLPSSYTSIELTTFLSGCVRTPLVLSIIQDYLRCQVGFRIYALLRQVLVGPDRPDTISAIVSDEMGHVEGRSIPGVGYHRTMDDLTRPGRFYGPRTFMGALRYAFPPMYSALNFLTGGHIAASRGRLEPRTEQGLITQFAQTYENRRRTWAAPTFTCGSIVDIGIRRDIMYFVFATVGLDPHEELVDPYAWVDGVCNRTHCTGSGSLLASMSMDDIDHDDYVRLSNRYRGRGIGQAVVSEVHSPSTGQEPTTNPLQNGSNLDRSSRQDIPNGRTDITTLNWARDGDNLEPWIQNNGTFSVIVNGVGTVLTELPLGRLSPSTDGYLHLYPVLENSDTAVSSSDNIIVIPNPRFTVCFGGQYMSATSTDTTPQSGQSRERGRSPSTIPQTPPQGIVRAVSLIEPRAQSPLLNPEPRRVRRPTDVTDDMAAQIIADALHDRRSPSPILGRNRRRGSQTSSSDDHDQSDRRTWRRTVPLVPVQKSQHRVTLLSTFAADTLAWHASAIITTLVLLPLESIYLRSVAHWFLSSPAMARYVDRTGMMGTVNAVFGGTVRVFGMGDWFGGAESRTYSSKARYCGSLILMVGLETIVRGLVWQFGTRTAIKKGNSLGWGTF